MGRRGAGHVDRVPPVQASKLAGVLASKASGAARRRTAGGGCPHVPLTTSLSSRPERSEASEVEGPCALPGSANRRASLGRAGEDICPYVTGQ